ncbi:hypothetical protein A2U01_0045673, partial [Trifolium medium]|nr:hypothetical protein [Trifolium medium]
MVCGGSATGALNAARRKRFIEGLRSCGRMVITGNKHSWEMDYMPKPRFLHDMIILPTATLLPDGRVLVAGSNPHGTYTFHNAAYPTELRLQAFVPHYMEK